MFIKYSTSQIPPKKSRGKGLEGKKTTYTTEETIDIFEESDPEPARKELLAEECCRRGSSKRVKEDVFNPSQKLKGIQTLTPKEQIATEMMKALKESKKTNRRQPGTGGSSEGTGVSPGVPNESTVVPATSNEGTDTKPGVPNKEKVDTDEEEEKKDDDDDKSINLEQTDDEETNDEFMYAEEHVQDDDEETNDESVKGDEYVNDDEDEEMTNAKVEEFENGDEEITDVAKRHTADLIQKYSVKPAPKPIKIQKPSIDLEPESEKSSLEIHKIKKEQFEKKKMLKYTIKSTDKATLKEYDLKNALYQTMNENKTFNRNSVNHALYHALMEALIEDNNVMDKGVVDMIKNHKRQHDDDDEDPSAGPN
uniref:Uncharacterized protein n=1 Tax=Tanacetum cinerariifolium TaxID=118510 RepID=A0A6L2K5M7_TANCI|nr:hypothetical protein [Tanacetum cinerariifolium]